MRLFLLAANAQADAIGELLTGGRLQVLSGATILAECRFMAFHRAEEGQLIAAALAPDPQARATGRPDRFRCVTAGGEPVLEGSVGAEGEADLLIDLPIIRLGSEVILTEFRYTVPLGEPAAFSLEELGHRG